MSNNFFGFPVLNWSKVPFLLFVFLFHCSPQVYLLKDLRDRLTLRGIPGTLHAKNLLAKQNNYLFVASEGHGKSWKSNMLGKIEKITD